MSDIKIKVPLNTYKIKKKIKELQDKYSGISVEVGIVNGATGVDARTGKVKDINIAEEAFYNCKGVPEKNIPPRDYQAQSIGLHSKKWSETTKKYLKKGMHGEDVLEAVGIIASEDTVRTIEEGNFERNKPSTIKRKGKDSPLIDYGDLIRNITYKVINENLK